MNTLVAHLQRLSLLILVLATGLMMQSCQLVADIFSAGMYVGVLGVIVVVAAIFWLLSRMRR